MAQLHGARWSLEPDWKFQLAAQQYEDTELMSTTAGLNVLRYFVDDPAGNIACVGAFRGDLGGIAELTELYRTEQVKSDCMLTASYHIRPSDIMAPARLKVIEDTVIRPLADLRNGGRIVLTDFTALVATWKDEFAGRACQYDLTPGR